MSKPIIGIAGAGKLGITLAQIARESGYEVLVATSKPAEKIELTVSVLAPGAQAVSLQELGEKADIIILALPLSKYQNLPREIFLGKLVIDAMNYWWEVDGENDYYFANQTTTSESVAAYLNGSTVVKAFNHMGYHDLATESKKQGDDKKVIALAGNDSESLKVVEELIIDFGFLPLLIGDLASGAVLEPGTPLFGANLRMADFKEVLETLQNS